MRGLKERTWSGDVEGEPSGSQKRAYFGACACSDCQIECGCHSPNVGAGGPVVVEQIVRVGVPKGSGDGSRFPGHWLSDQLFPLEVVVLPLSVLVTIGSLTLVNVLFVTSA